MFVIILTLHTCPRQDLLIIQIGYSRYNVHLKS
ncbi:hypothetical protein VPH5P1C_0262 [Vibrio phage 5P1c]|nr:hypothetical protein VP495E541_P0267 [Vibrio phage 495E54-1]CAH9014922.1 hypothetical protein VP496E541_P0259 [Vibrio phage 496E54-1]